MIELAFVIVALALLGAEQWDARARRRARRAATRARLQQMVVVLDGRHLAEAVVRPSLLSDARRLS